ncbi:MAG: N-acyl homoserine lactonase family protein [Nitrospirota bacterium]
MRRRAPLTAAFRVVTFMAVATFFAIALGERSQTGSPGAKKQLSSPLRLYVFDCGILHIADVRSFGLKPKEVAASDLPLPCFLIVHPKGTLMWDTGAVPDAAWAPNGKEVTYDVVLPDSQKYGVTMVKSLAQQLAEVGYSPADVTYLALSHYHFDHTANANQFVNATWLVGQEDNGLMFAKTPPDLTQPSTYAALRDHETIIIKNDNYDVFGDGTVVIKRAPGHTPGHQVLYLKLAKTGGVVLSGDLYHYPEERVLDRVPTFEFDANKTRETRAAIGTFLKKSGAQLWIQHDLGANSKLKKAPNYYD